MAQRQRSTTRPTATTAQCAFLFPSAFTAHTLQRNAPKPGNARSFRPSRTAPRCRGQGFGKPPAQPEAKLNTRSWAEKYKSYVKRNGELLCAMAWEGYETLGRGAVFANYDDAARSVAMVDRGGKDMQSTTPSFYVDRDKLVEMNDKEQLAQMKHILHRIAVYNPQTQFVVVFEADGTQGADIVTPNHAPSEVWARTRKDGGKMFDWNKK